MSLVYSSGLSPQIARAGQWFLTSGIQESDGGVARYFHTDLNRNHAISTEITGYAASTFVYLHSLSGEERYLDGAIAAATFLAQTAWDAASGVMPFEISPPRFSYFFDCGIIVRGLLAVWRVTRQDLLLEIAIAVGDSMARDFAATGEFHPILTLPGREPVARDAGRWSRSPGCYQLKSAMAWTDLAEAAQDSHFRHLYESVLESSLRTYGSFLPGNPDRAKVMDRLHAFCYFLEGLLPRASNPRCAAALCNGIQVAAAHLRDIAPEFERSDVYAQLLRARLHAAAAGAVPLDHKAAAWEAAQLGNFQSEGGGFYFGRKDGAWLPFLNPVSTGFALQALELWESRCAPDPRQLI